VTGEDFPGNRGSHEGPDAARQHFYHGFTKLHRDISLIRKPTVAMINGPAVGSGMDMALHCDIRIGCEKTRFIGYHNAGQIIENGGSYYLPKMVGLGRALEFAYTGELDAQRAYDWGMLNHLVPSDKLEETTRALCDPHHQGAARWCSGSASASCARRWTARSRPPWSSPRMPAVS
jgi:enoyl-CoA hydratase/carnithine racemase